MDNKPPYDDINNRFDIECHVYNNYLILGRRGRLIIDYDIA